ncbi:MAG: efflux RND transporter periplasmic adaptor subunit [Myxococcales bacterium]|nr:efflux RND transporter periplasmic adaptor subunit [Myxococcales bacterium]
MTPVSLRSPGALCVLFFTLASSACSSEKAAAGKDAGARLPLVQVVTVQPVDEQIRRSFLVTLQPQEQVGVSAKTSGYVTAWFVDRGDRVRRGQRLAVIERDELTEQQRQAAAGLQSSQATLENARQNLERLERLLRDQLVSQAEVDAARTALRTAEAQVEVAQANLGLSRMRAGYADILAPFDGVVMKRNAEVGSLVSPGGQPLFLMAAIGRIKAVAAVPQADLRFLREGHPVILTVDGLPGRLPGVLKRFSPGLDPATRTMEVEMEFDNPERALLPGMFGRAEVVLEELKGVLLASPLSLARQEGGTGRAYVVEGDRAREVTLRLGRTLPDGRVEVVEGLSAGDRLVVVGRELLRDGVNVRTVDAPGGGK